MLGSLRAGLSLRPLLACGFATTRPAGDMSRLTLIGVLVRDPEARLTKNEKEYITYTVATRNVSLPNADGERPPSTSTFHRITSFKEPSNNYLRTLKKGSKVYVEAAFEIKEPQPDADPTTPQGQRQIFLRHETIRVVHHKVENAESSVSTESEAGHGF